MERSQIQMLLSKKKKVYHFERVMAKCKKIVWTGNRPQGLTSHQCTRIAVRDGWCKIHHPDEQKKRDDKKAKRLMAMWVAVTERLPDLTDKEFTYGHKVIACWGNSRNTMAQMNYRTRTVRGKKIDYFEWNRRIDPFGVKCWMEFPQPPNFP